MAENKIEKIVIYYESGTQREIKDGLAMYTMNNDQDAQAEFVGIDDYKKLNALCNALLHSLQLAQKEWREMEERERG